MAPKCDTEQKQHRAKMTPSQMSPPYQLTGANGSPIPSVSHGINKFKKKKQNKLLKKRHDKDFGCFTNCSLNSEKILITQ